MSRSRRYAYGHGLVDVVAGLCGNEFAFFDLVAVGIGGLLTILRQVGVVEAYARDESTGHAVLVVVFLKRVPQVRLHPQMVVV